MLSISRADILKCACVHSRPQSSSLLRMTDSEKSSFVRGQESEGSGVENGMRQVHLSMRTEGIKAFSKNLFKTDTAL